MDFVKKFEQLMLEDTFLFSEDVKKYLISNKLLNEDNPLVTLRRRFHTASPAEKSIIKKAIEQLERKKVVEKAKQGKQTKTLANRYEIHLDWGKPEFKIETHPDTWFRTKNPKGEVFVYFIHTGNLIYDNANVRHYDLIEEAIDDGNISIEDIPPNIDFDKQDEEESDLLGLVTSTIDIVSDICIHGRTGYGVGNPSYGDADEIEKFEEEPCGSIWQENVNPKELVKAFDEVNNINDMDGMIRHWFIPDKKLG